MTEQAKAARREYRKKWREANADKVKAYNKDWAQRNPDKVRGYHNKWQRNNPDKVRGYVDSYWERKAAAADQGTGTT